MVGSTTLYTVPLVLAAGVSFVLFVLTAMHREERGAYPMMGFLGSITIWSLGYALQLTTGTMSGAIRWSNVKYFGIALAPVATLIFALEYTGRDRHVTALKAAALLAVPVVTNVIMWTNPFHNLWADPYFYGQLESRVGDLTWKSGPWYDVHVVYSFAVSLVAAGLFVDAWREEASDRIVNKSAVLLLALVLPMIGSALTVAGLVPLDAAPFAFTISGAAIVATIFHF